MTDYAIEIRDDCGVTDFPEQRVRDAISYILSRHNAAENTGVTFVLMNDDAIRTLNAQYRGVDAPTDILSFPNEDDDLPPEMDDEPPYLGDLLVAYPYTVHQAEEAGHTLGDEFALLAIHGTLHLLGYDHDTAAHEEVMWAAQSAALAALGVAIDVPRFTFGDSLEP